ncbi:unnamed protein product [Prunus armeniaca]
MLRELAVYCTCTQIEKLARHLSSQIGQVAGEIVTHLCTKYMYTQISKADLERGKWPTTCAVISGRQVAGEIIVGHLRTMCRYTQISKAKCKRGKWPTTCAIISGRCLGKSLSDTSVLSVDTRKYLKVAGNGEIGPPPAKSNRVGGWENHCRTPVYQV